MSTTYAETIALVRMWANRDISALPDEIIADSMRWAADKAYRTLRVPPLEQIVNYSADTLTANTHASNNRLSSFTSLGIPGDLIEFIRLREVDEEGRTVRIFNEKTDVRTFRDTYSDRYSDEATWTREAGNILYSPGFGNVGTNLGSSGVGQATGLELYYYRRLPALNATFEVTPVNFAANRLTRVTSGGTQLFFDPLPSGRTTPVPGEDVAFAETDTNRISFFFVGNEVPHWLRDENERIILFGALAECFAYLQEDDQAQKYGGLFYQEIDELNREDQMRNASGGNIQQHFNGRGLI